MTLSEYYINRNVKIIERVQELKTLKVGDGPTIFNTVGAEFTLSAYTVKAVFHDRSYAYAKEAWKIFNNSKAN